jgi:hypothetical protein
MAALFVNGSELNEQSLYRIFQGCFLPSFDSFDRADDGRQVMVKAHVAFGKVS